MAEIFLMEDSAALRRMLIEDLRSGGHNVTALPDGGESWDVAFLDNADVLVTDLGMPNVDGFEVIQTVRASHPALPIIVITGNPPKELPELRCDHLFHKPVRGSDLLDVIAGLTSKKPETV